MLLYVAWASYFSPFTSIFCSPQTSQHFFFPQGVAKEDGMENSCSYQSPSPPYHTPFLTQLHLAVEKAYLKKDSTLLYSCVSCYVSCCEYSPFNSQLLWKVRTIRITVTISQVLRLQESGDCSLQHFPSRNETNREWESETIPRTSLFLCVLLLQAYYSSILSPNHFNGCTPHECFTPQI